MFEHVKGLHGSTTEKEAFPNDSTLTTLAAEESKGPKLPDACLPEKPPSVDTLSPLSKSYVGYNTSISSNPRQVVSAKALEKVPLESQEQFESRNNPDLDSAPSSFDAGKWLEGGNVSSDKSLDTVFVSMDLTTAHTASELEYDDAESLPVVQTGNGQRRNKTSDDSSTSSSIEALFSQLPFRTRVGESSDARFNDTRPFSTNNGTTSGKNGSHKRRRTTNNDDQQNNDDESGGEDDERRMNKNGQSSQDNSPGEFACPFFKRDPRKFHSCAKFKLKGINRVK
jgi:hypothetical protein